MAFFDGICPSGNKCKYSDNIEKIKKLIYKIIILKKNNKKRTLQRIKIIFKSTKKNIYSSCFSFYNYEDKSIINNNSSSNLNIFHNNNDIYNDNNLDDIKNNLIIFHQIMSNIY